MQSLSGAEYEKCSLWSRAGLTGGLFAELYLVFLRVRRLFGGFEGTLEFVLAELFALLLALPFAATLRVTHTVRHAPTPLSSLADSIICRRD
jgi:hypothetical protein